MRAYRSSTDVFPMRLSGLGAALAFCAALSGCGSTPKPIEVTPEQFPATVREDFDVFFLGDPNRPGERVHVGYVYHQSDGRSDDRYWVQNLDRQNLGILVDDFQAYRIDQVKTDDGKDSVEHVDLGNHGLEGGVLRIFGFKAGPVELEKRFSSQPAKGAGVGGS